MLEVREQARLPVKRLLEICLDSISYRLMRSLVTVVIILLAIAFLAVMMVEGYLGRSIRDTVQDRARRMTAYSRFLSEVSDVESDEELVRSFARVREDSAAFANLMRWGESTPEGTRQFVQRSQAVEAYLRFFEGLRLGQRMILVGRNTGLQIFNALSNPEGFETFAEQLAPMKSLRLPGGLKGFQDFLAGWPEHRARLAVIRKSYMQTVRKIAEFCGAEGVGGKLRAAIAAGEVPKFFTQIDADPQGFRVEKDEIPDIVQGLAYQEELAWAFVQLKKERVRAGWNRKFDESFTPGEALASCAVSPRRVDWIRETLAEAKQDKDFDPQRLLKVAAAYRQRSELLGQEQRLVSRYGQTQRLSQKTLWLIFVSFLVCVVGIANAMLMSVLERFKEIATMKCLGARNSTIAFLFVTESVIIGVVGGFIGIVLGFLIVLARLMISYRALVFVSFPARDILVTFGVCFCCSLLLAMAAAIYPAWVASRMAPMEAMRVD